MVEWTNSLVMEKWLSELVIVMKEIRDELQEINRNMEDQHALITELNYTLQEKINIKGGGDNVILK